MIEDEIKAIKEHVKRVLAMLNRPDVPPREVQQAVFAFLRKSLAEIDALRKQERKEQEKKSKDIESHTLEELDRLQKEAAGKPDQAEMQERANILDELKRIAELQKAEEEQKGVADVLVNPEDNVIRGDITAEPPLNPMNHPSSNINAFRYDPKSQQLYVKFQGKYPMQNGPIYKYAGVPEDIVKIFARGAVAPKTSGKNAWHRWRKGVTPSHGAAMNALIKSGGFEYTRVK